MTMMNKAGLKLVLAAMLVTAPAAPALAGWKLVPRGTATPVLTTKLTITPGEDWNRSSTRPIKKGEVWTLDGVSLNELYLVSGLAAGETLYRDVAKKDRPLPKLRAGMDLTEIAEFFESSSRLTLNTSVFETSSVEPVTFLGTQGVRVRYEYAVQGSTLRRKGVATAAQIGGQLYLINFTAPAIHYFDRDAPKAEAIMASAHL